MAKKQTRRSISYSRADYEAAQEAAQRAGVPVAQLAAEALHEYLDRRAARAQVAGRDARAPFTVADIKQAVAGLHEIKPGDDGIVMVPIDAAPQAPKIDELIDRSSVGAGLRDIEERGIDAHLVELDEELRAAERSSADVQVMYDEDVQARRTAAAARRRR